MDVPARDDGRAASGRANALRPTRKASGETGPRWATRSCTVPVRLAAVAVLLTAILPAVPSAAAVTVRQVEKGIRDYMNRKFKCTDLKVQVVPHADPALLQQGRLQTVIISVKRADKEGIIMNGLYLKATDVTVSLDALFRLGKLRTASRKSTDIRATIKEGELNKAFARAKIPIKQFKVKFDNGMVVATGVYEFVFGNKLRMVARLVPKKDGVHFAARHASVNGQPLPIGQVNALLAKMNPLINFADIPFSPEVTKIVIQKDTLTISG